MTEKAVDENGRVVESPVKKVVEPRPAPEDYTRIRTGPEPGDYEYLDPASLFAAERYVAARRAGDKPVKAGRGHRKALRDLAEKALEWWPPQGHVKRWTDWQGLTDFPAIVQDLADGLGASSATLHEVQMLPYGGDECGTEPDLLEDPSGSEQVEGEVLVIPLEGLQPEAECDPCSACGSRDDVISGWWPEFGCDVLMCAVCWSRVAPAADASAPAGAPPFPG